MKYTLKDIENGIEQSYAVFARHRADNDHKMAEFRARGCIFETRRVDFECKRDVTLTQFKEFVANLPDNDEEIDISFDGDELNIHVYESHIVKGQDALDKLWGWSAFHIAQYRYYLVAKHVHEYMIENNLEVLSETHYQSVRYKKLLELEQNNVLPEGFDPKEYNR